MSSKRSLPRAPSFGCPFTKCFGGGGSKQIRSSSSSSISVLDQQINGGYGNAGYGRLGTIEDNVSGQKVPTLQLGGEPYSTPRKSKPRRRSLSFSSMAGDAKGSLSSRVREACEQVLGVAKKGTPYINDLFVGNQLLLQVAPTSSLSKHCRTTTISPSSGFVHTPVRHTDTSLHER